MLITLHFLTGFCGKKFSETYCTGQVQIVFETSSEKRAGRSVKTYRIKHLKTKFNYPVLEIELS